MLDLNRIECNASNENIQKSRVTARKLVTKQVLIKTIIK